MNRNATHVLSENVRRQMSLRGWGLVETQKRTCVSAAVAFVTAGASLRRARAIATRLFLAIHGFARVLFLLHVASREERNDGPCSDQQPQWPSDHERCERPRYAAEQCQAH